MIPDAQILALYTQAYNQARQVGGGGRETPHQIAHIAGLHALVAVGDGKDGQIQPAPPPVIQPEDPAVAYQRRLTFASHWLDEAGRRQQIAAHPTFTHVTDAFAAGGLYEYTQLVGNKKIDELIGPVLKAEENAVHAQLTRAQGMETLLNDLHNIVGAETPEELLATIQNWAANAKTSTPSELEKTNE